jgi:hypothetical protein
MSRTLLCLLVVAGWLPVASAADPDFSAVKSPPPAHGDAQIVGGVLFLTRARVVMIPETRLGTRTVDGKEETYTYTTYSPQNQPENYSLNPDDYRVFGVDGQPLDGTNAGRRLRLTTPVLVSDDGRKVDPIYLKLYKPDTLVIYVRPGMEPPPPPEPPAAPAPIGPPPPAAGT